MLGLGRALGETMAVAMVLSARRRDHAQPDLQRRTRATIAANIALNFTEATPGTAVNVLIATGLVLFVVTFAVNFAGPLDRRRRSERRLAR